MAKPTHTVLVTGSSGAVGSPVVRELLARGHRVRGLNRRPSSGPEEAFSGGIADREAVDRAMHGCDAVVHLAAATDDAPFLDVLEKPNVVGLFQIMDAARELGVKRVVLASTMQTISGVKGKEGLITADDAAPRNHYALTKIWAERMGEMYARCYEMSVIASRIGWLPRNATDADRLSRHGGGNTYLSPGDAGRFHADAVEADLPDGTFITLYAVSKPAKEQRVEIEPATRLIGYQPRDVWPEGLNFEWPT